MEADSHDGRTAGPAQDDTWPATRAGRLLPAFMSAVFNLAFARSVMNTVLSETALDASLRTPSVGSSALYAARGPRSELRRR